MKRTLQLLAVVCLLALGAFAQQQQTYGNLTAQAADCSTTASAGIVVLQFPSDQTGSASIDLAGTFTATISFKVSSDGTNWRAIQGTPIGGGAAVTSATAAGNWKFSVGGYRYICAFASAYTNGTANVVINSGRVSAGAGGGAGFSSGGATANVLPKGDGFSGLKDSSITDSGTVISTSEAFNGAAGTQALPGVTAGFTNQGMWGTDSTHLALVGNGEVRFYSSTSVSNTLFGFTGDKLYGVTGGNSITDLGSSTFPWRNLFLVGTQNITSAANAANYGCAWSSELLTLSTSGTTTDTSANLLPANSVILAVTARITTTIATATSWQLGDPTTAGRFTPANATMTANTTDIGKVFMTTGIASATTGMSQVAAAKVRVTTVGTPSAGIVRISVLACSITPPTS